jgi:transcriptional regulator with XRE-family HTH domain
VLAYRGRHNQEARTLRTRIIEISDLAVAIEDRMAELNLSATATARLLDVSPQRLSQWRHGTRINMDARLQERIAAFLGITPLAVLELAGYSTSTRTTNLSSGNGPFPGLLCGKRLTLAAVA